VIATPYKSGTTWMQLIVWRLLFQDGQERPAFSGLSPWLDFAPAPLGEVLARLEAQSHRRFIKTHLPLDGLPYFPQLKYVVVSRDPRDVFMSMWNHYRSFTADSFAWFNGRADRVGPPLPPCPEDVRAFWRDWITRGWFDWESEGYPFWSCLRHVQTWWDFRALPNLLFVHFNHLLADLEGQIRRVADFLAIAVAEDKLREIASAVHFSNVKRNAEQLLPGAHRIWQGGAKTFFNKGTNGRWRDVLTKEDLALYEAAASHELSDGCRSWLERGALDAA